jgi:hypothetical protein
MERNKVSPTNVGKGWQPIVRIVISECDTRGVIITQIKEKFGGLRIYTKHSHPGIEFIDGMIRLAERVCAITCEFCGAPGQRITTKRQWLKTLCNSCATKEANSYPSRYSTNE